MIIHVIMPAACLFCCSIGVDGPPPHLDIFTLGAAESDLIGFGLNSGAADDYAGNLMCTQVTRGKVDKAIWMRGKGGLCKRKTLLRHSPDSISQA